MSLSQQQVNYIASLDLIANQILNSGDNKALLMSLRRKIDGIRDIINSASKDELNIYCSKYDGFSKYISLLQHLTHEYSDTEMIE